MLNPEKWGHKPLKVAFVSPFLFRYLRGIERYTVDLSNALASNGVEVHLLTWKEKKDWPWERLHENVRVHALSLPRYFTSVWANFAYLGSLLFIKPDVLNIFFSWHGEKLSTKWLPYTKNLILHAPLDCIRGRYEQFKEVIPHVKKIIAVSDYVRRGAEDCWARSVDVIPNGVDAKQFYPSLDKSEAKRALKIPEEAAVFITLGALEKRKGVHKVLDALQRVVKTHTKFKYLIVGDGPENENLYRQCKILNLEEHVLFLESMPDPLKIYHAADFFILLSSGEASGLVVLEAMACGLPILVAKRRPFNEYLPEEGNIFVNDEDPEAVSVAIKTFLEMPQETLAKIGLKNRSIVEQHYSWQKVAEKYKSLFQEELKRR